MLRRKKHGMKTHLYRISALILSILMLFLAGFGSISAVRAEASDTAESETAAASEPQETAAGDTETEDTETLSGFAPFYFGGPDEDDLAVSDPEGSLDLGPFDFGSLEAGFLCLKAKLTGAESALLSFYMDEDQDSFAQITVCGEPKEQESEELSDEGDEFYKSSDFDTSTVLLQGLGITGKHHIRMDYVIRKSSADHAELLLQRLFFAENSLPILEICIDETKGSIQEMNGDPDHETKCFGSMKLHIPAGYQEEYTGTVYEAAVTEEYEMDYIRGRGNSTWGRLKKPYRIKLENKEDLLGMGKDKHWAVIANYFDMTMLRNKIAYDIASRFLPEGSFVIQSAFVHVVMNDKYLGLYTLSELVRVGKERLNIDDLEDLKGEEQEDEELITGGYLMNMESMNPEGKIIKTPRYTFAADSPDPAYFSEKEEVYLTGYLTELEERIFEAPEGEALAACEDMLDIDSYIDYYLIQELCMNGDAFKSDSDHFYKVRNDKVYFGPLWDFDYVSWAGDKLDVEGFPSADWAPWMVPLLQDDTFRERLTKRWEELKKLMTEYMEEDGAFDQYVSSIYMAQRTNYNAVSSYLWDEEVPGFTEELGEQITFESEVLRLKTWITERISWIDAHISEIRPSRVHVEFRDGTRLIQHLMLNRDELLTDNYVPQPMKEGYRFIRWIRMDAAGNEAELTEEDTQDEAVDLLIYQAEWEAYDPDAELKELKFTEEAYEMPSFKYVLLSELVLTEPEDFDKRFLQFSMECDPEDCAYLSDDALTLMQNGEVRITAVCGSHKASCRIVIVEEDED